ncbi:hypothetical protein [Spirosoma sp. KNUC1025]
MHRRRIRDQYTKKEQYIVIPDGTKLLTSIYLPTDNAEKHPF